MDGAGEIFALFGAHTTADAIFTTLQASGFKHMGLQTIPGSHWRGTQDERELVFERHEWDRFMERFHTIAQRLGYVKKRQNR